VNALHYTKPALQVIVHGHRLSAETKDFLRAEYGELRIISAYVHSEKLCDTGLAVTAVYARIASLVDKDIPVILALPGLSTAASLVTQEAHKLLGYAPGIINFIQLPSRTYVPSPETPILGNVPASLPLPVAA